jgi:hypothetical protein
MDPEAEYHFNKRPDKLYVSSRIYAKLTDKEDGNPFLHTHHNWPYQVLDD